MSIDIIDRAKRCPMYNKSHEYQCVLPIDHGGFHRAWINQCELLMFEDGVKIP